MAPLIEANRIRFEYDGPPAILSNLSFTVQPGEFVALIGQNGSGKTTLAKLLLGLLRPTEGRILIDGKDIATQSVATLARSVGYVFQNPDHQIFAQTVLQEISFGVSQLALDPTVEKARIRHAMDQFGLAEHAEKSPHMLSYGLRRKLTVASVVAMRAPIIILDEPTSGLDRYAATSLLDVVSRLNEDGHSVILITHDMRLVATYATRVALIHAGRIAAFDDTLEILYQSELLRSAGIVQPPIVQLSQNLAMDQSPLTPEQLCLALTGSEIAS